MIERERNTAGWAYHNTTLDLARQLRGGGRVHFQDMIMVPAASAVSVLGFVARLGGLDVDEQRWQKRVVQILEPRYSSPCSFLSLS